MAAIEIVVARRGEYLDEASQIWAEATAARDGDAEIAPVEVSRPILDSVVNGSTGAVLLIAVDDRGASVGFAAAQPVASELAHRAEPRYIGVRPRAWGTGVAAQLLLALERELRSRGFVEATLYVYLDNHRAVDLYRRLGWRPQAEVRVHPRSGRREQLYARCLATQGPTG